MMKKMVFFVFLLTAAFMILYLSLNLFRHSDWMPPQWKSMDELGFVERHALVNVPVVGDYIQWKKVEFEDQFPGLDSVV